MGLRVHRVGSDALLVDCTDLAEAMALHAEARRRDVPAHDVVPGARTVLFDGVADPAALADEIGSWRLEPGSSVAGDLVAGHVPALRDEVVDTHRGTEFVVAFCGFAPGFAYCSGLPDRLAVPRLDSPRTKVPAGSVGLAGAFTGVYPTASPGGWRIIGTTTAPLWDADRESPALLAPGTRVRFVDA